MDFRLSKLKNNLPIITIPMPNLESATVEVWVRTGSRNEQDEILGLSHFLEHMAFKGGTKYPSAKAVSTAIDAIGGEFNAGTSKEWTKFYVRARSAHLEKAFDVLSDIILRPQLREKEISKEKGVIIEEMRMYEDTPIKRVWDYFEQLIYPRHPLGRDIIGNPNTVRSFKQKDFIKYRSETYYSQNMLISVAGGVSENMVKALAEKYFGKVEDNNKIETPLSEPKQANPRTKLYSKQIEQAHFIVGFPAAPMGSEDRYKDSVLTTILGGGMSSRLFTEVREKRGLAYSVRADMDRFLDTGYFAVYAGVDPAKCEEAVKIIQKELYKLSEGKSKVGRQELDKAKEFLKGHLALSLEDTRDVSDFFAHEYLMLGRSRSPEEVFDMVDKVTSNDLTTSAQKIFNPKMANLCIIGPYKDVTRFEKLL